MSFENSNKIKYVVIVSIMILFFLILLFEGIFVYLECFIWSENIVIEKIKTQIAQMLPLSSKTGLFVSAFDSSGNLLASNGVIKTDRSVEQLVDSFYQGILKKYENQIKSLIFDFVDQLQLQNDPNTLVKLSMKERGLFLVQSEGQNSGVLLPNTKGVDTIQQGLSFIKQKYNLQSQVSVFIFKTKRVQIIKE